MRKIFRLIWFATIQILVINQAECQPAIKSDSVYYWKYYSQTDPTVELKLRDRVIDIVYDSDKILSQVGQRLIDGSWENNVKYTNVYDDEGNQTLFMSQLWKNGSWVNWEKRVWSYDNRGNEIERLNAVWENDAWINDSKSVKEWNDYNKKVSSTYFRWDGIYWVNNGKEMITYTADGDESVISRYDWVYGIWENQDRYSYSYNQDHQRIASVYEQWYEHNWLKQDSNLFSYETPALYSTIMDYHWNMVNREWYLSGRTVFEYSSNYNSMVSTIQNGNEGNWHNFERFFYTSTGDGTWMIDHLDRWNNEDWQPTWDIKRHYFDSTHMYIYVSKTWDYDNQLRSWDSTYWVPPTPNGSKENHLCINNLLVFPNPSDGFFRVITDMKPMSISIYDLKGELVYCDYLAGRKSSDIDLRSLPTGLYNIDTFDGSQRKTAKVIIKR